MVSQFHFIYLYLFSLHTLQNNWPWLVQMPVLSFANHRLGFWDHLSVPSITLSIPHVWFSDACSFLVTCVFWKTGPVMLRLVRRRAEGLGGLLCCQRRFQHHHHHQQNQRSVIAIRREDVNVWERRAPLHHDTSGRWQQLGIRCSSSPPTDGPSTTEWVTELVFCIWSS